jgi:UDP-glucuronate 4-epimerase
MLMSENRKTILVTGAAGFIGFHTCKHLIQKGYQVIGVDSLEDDINIALKIKRLSELGVRLSPGFIGRISNVIHGRFSFFKSDVRDGDLWTLIKDKYSVDQVIHLAIREAKKEDVEFSGKFSSDHFDGFMQVLDFCADTKVGKLFYAHTMHATTPQMNFNSISTPTDELDTLNNDILWMNDYLAHVYLKLYNLQALALDFPQVFGDWNRLDGLYHQLFGEEKKTEAADQLLWNATASSAKYCAVEAITSDLLRWIEDQNPSFDQVASALGVDSWKDSEELRSMIKA